MLRGMDERDDIRAAVDRLPLDAVRDATTEAPAWVVGGVVRDLLRGVAAPTDVDVAIEGEIEPVLERLQGAGVSLEATHSRFGTATALSGGLRIDLSRTRRETYPFPGSLPEVEPAGIDDDLRRRDFTVNAMAIPLTGPGGLVDPTGGEADLSHGVLRVLHDASFADDPTRAIRAARYASRLGLEPDPRTLGLLEATDLSTVSADRRSAELARLAAEPKAPAGFRLLAEWGVVGLDADALDLIAAVDATAAQAPWSSDPTLRDAGDPARRGRRSPARRGSHPGSGRAGAAVGGRAALRRPFAGGDPRGGRRGGRVARRLRGALARRPARDRRR